MDLLVDGANNTVMAGFPTGAGSGEVVIASFDTMGGQRYRDVFSLANDAGAPSSLQASRLTATSDGVLSIGGTLGTTYPHGAFFHRYGK